MSSDEARFLILATREADTASDDELRRAAERIQDWTGVAELAAAHGLAAYAVRALARTAVLLPEAGAAVLQDADVAAVAMSLAVDTRLAPTLAAVAAQGISSIVLKGPVLSRTIYPDRSLRPYRDLDLVVRMGDLDEAVVALVAAGLVEVPSREAPFHRVFVDRQGRALVELHTDPFQLGLPPVAEDDRWRRARAAPELAPSALVLDDADQLLHLCVHAHKHGFSRLIWLKDLDLILRRHASTLDASLLEHSARLEGVGASVWYALTLAREILGAPDLPVRRALAPAAPIRAVYRRLWPRHDVAGLDARTRLRAVQFDPGSARGMLPSLVTMGRRRERARLVARRLVSGVRDRGAGARRGPP